MTFPIRHRGGSVNIVSSTNTSVISSSSKITSGIYTRNRVKNIQDSPMKR